MHHTGNASIGIDEMCIRDRKVTGRVMDAQGELLIGVNVTDGFICSAHRPDVVMLRIWRVSL